MAAFFILFTTNLAQNVLAADTSITVRSDTPAPPQFPFNIQVDFEQMLVTSGAANVWLVTRGQNATLATSHAFGSGVFPLIPSALGSFVKSTTLTTGTSFVTSGSTSTIKLRMAAGGGGGGGGAATSSNSDAGGGGGAGSYAEKIFSVLSNTAYTYAIGTAGLGATAGNNAGGTGGITTFNANGITVTCNGGLGGGGAAAAGGALGGAGGAISTNGDVNEAGANGGGSQILSATVAISLGGAPTPFGGGAAGILPNTQQLVGAVGPSYGSGGGGGGNGSTQTAVAGGAGGAGVIVVDEYSLPTAGPTTGSYLKSTTLTSGTSFVTGGATNLIKIRMAAGGGGSGGGAATTSQCSVGGAGGGGGYAEKTFSVTPNTTYAYTIGAGGIAGTSGPGAGGAGGTTTFIANGITVTCNGGLGGAAGTATGLNVTAPAGGGAISTNGDVNLSGNPSVAGVVISTAICSSGAGGGGELGSGGLGITLSAGGITAANPGLGFGAGAGGPAASGTQIAQAGAAGAPGVIIVAEFSVPTMAPAAGAFIKSSYLTTGTSFLTSGLTTRIKLRMVAGGGGSGGCALTGAGAADGSGSGGAGSYAEKTFSVAPNTAYAYTIGAGGLAGTAGQNTGGVGGTTTFVVGSTTITCNGGLGGLGADSTGINGLGGAGGAISTNGDYNAPGGSGFQGGVAIATAIIGLAFPGAPSPFGGGGQGGFTTTQRLGLAGSNPGTGGGGTSNGASQGAAAGAAGATGAIFVDEYM